MEEKYRIQQIILSAIQRHKKAIVTGDILDEAFPEMSREAQDITIFAFSAKDKRPPPLTRSEQIEQFCKINNLLFEMDMIKNMGTFTQAASD